MSHSQQISRLTVKGFLKLPAFGQNSKAGEMAAASTRMTFCPHRSDVLPKAGNAIGEENSPSEAVNLEANNITANEMQEIESAVGRMTRKRAVSYEELYPTLFRRRRKLPAARVKRASVVPTAKIPGGFPNSVESENTVPVESTPDFVSAKASVKGDGAVKRTKRKRSRRRKQRKSINSKCHIVSS
ncbi:unnamed protein product [Gongylonema pulchrum]|uniref:Uncharacterized protein n=1 Tax=Gongylonema pulchrum TaxID=637853 RepID=A0A183ET37_9BILA|nr:unnamed protein product [Gongylonema pulchrum]